MPKDDLNVHAFQNKIWGSFTKDKNMGVGG